MAFPTPVNGQITDAVTQSSVATLAAAPTVAMGISYQSAAHSLSILYENTVQAQKMSSISAQAAANQGVIQIYSAGAAASAAATAKLANQGNNSTRLLEMLIIIKMLGIKL